MLLLLWSLRPVSSGRSLVVAGSAVCLGGLPPTGTLAPGKRVVLNAKYPPAPDMNEPAVAVVICRFGPYLMAWDAAGRHERQHLDRTRGVSNEDMFRRLYPDAPRIADLDAYGYTLVPDLSSL